MSKLNVDQKDIFSLLSDRKADFLIPDYQRPYAWGEEECQTLWDDIFTFAFPNNNKDEFKESDEYFLGSIVMFKNDNEKSEVIDGQQRLTTLMLFLRAFYDKFSNMQDKSSISIRELIEKCIWKTDSFGATDKSSLKIDSQVASDNDKEEFLMILRNGEGILNCKSKYLTNYQFFKSKINTFLNDYPGYFPYLPARLLNHCILLPIEAESQDTALRIFSTLNNRGLPLSDADIFKAQFYKFYSKKGEKETFINDWRNLEEITAKVFSSISSTPMDELFTRYMYYLRAKENNKNTTTESLRKFYERNKYQYLNLNHTINELTILAEFWNSIVFQDKEQFSEIALKKLYVLNSSPNGMWQHITSVYFLKNKNQDNKLNDEDFCEFLDRIIAFIFTYAITNPGVNALRTPIFDEMVNIVSGKKVTFAKYKFDKDLARAQFDNYVFTNQRNVTRSMMTWFAFSFETQELLKINDTFQLEHIYSKKRLAMEGKFNNEANLESLGNKILLEANINIKASDFRFEDKKRIYSGEVRRNKNKEKSQIAEINTLISYSDFDEEQIVTRYKTIIDKFFDYLKKQNLLINN